MDYVKQLPSNTRFMGYTYGWALSHPCGAEMVHVLYDDATHPEMTPGEHRYRIVRLALWLIYDGSVWPDEVTVTHFAGSHGTFTFTGTEAIEKLAEEYDLHHHKPGYWERLRQLAG